MALTAAQLQTLATDISGNTDQTVVDALAVGNMNAITAFYNSATDSFYVWRDSMTVKEMQNQHIDWSEFVSLTTNEMIAWQSLAASVEVNPAKASLREAFGSIFSGPSQGNTRAALVAAAKQVATHIQQLFADTSEGDGAEATPAVAVVDTVSRDDITAAVGLIGG